jgi:hypothetical protein
MSGSDAARREALAEALAGAMGVAWALGFFAAVQAALLKLHY